ncbi:Peptidase C19 ubiquitin carboxyl-terminal hydrolase 2 [Penicillium sp. DV-2018c]|nr:Peptidase C19 ubiquitin carboxyl-terminal hydrolase 2 [Penicillium sp. DV-2018c]
MSDSSFDGDQVSVASFPNAGQAGQAGQAAELGEPGETAEAAESGEEIGTAICTSLAARIPVPKDWSKSVVQRTRSGFKNPDGTQCYRNVSFQMLLHLPVFHNWLNIYIQCHCLDGTPCKMGGSTDTGPRECKLCELHKVYQAYWNDEKIPPVFHELTEKIFQDWKEPGARKEQEDAEEYLGKVYEQLYDATAPLFRHDLEEIFMMRITRKKMCRSTQPCPPIDTPQDQIILRLPLPNDVEGQTTDMNLALSQYFSREHNGKNCGTCGGKFVVHFREAFESFPEVLLIQLGRIDDNGLKIDRSVAVNETLVIKKDYHSKDQLTVENIGDYGKYQLSSVITHEGGNMYRGHYRIAIKGKDSKWRVSSDLKTNNLQTLDDNHYRTNGYVFAYRLLPTEDECLDITDAGITAGLAADSGPEVHATEMLPAPLPGASDAALEEIVTRAVAKEFTNIEAALGASLTRLLPNLLDDALDRRARKQAEEAGDGTGPEATFVKQRGLLQVTLTTQKGLGNKVLDIQSQGLVFNNLRREAVAKGAVAKRPIAKRAVAKRAAAKRAAAKRAAAKRAAAKRAVAKEVAAEEIVAEEIVAEEIVSADGDEERTAREEREIEVPQKRARESAEREEATGAEIRSSKRAKVSKGANGKTPTP